MMELLLDNIHLVNILLKRNKPSVFFQCWWILDNFSLKEFILKVQCLQRKIKTVSSLMPLTIEMWENRKLNHNEIKRKYPRLNIVAGTPSH